MSEAKCQWVVEALPAYLDGELDRADADVVRRHLRHCESCRARASLLDDTWETLEEAQAAPRARVAPDFTERMMARLDAEKQRQAAETRLRPRRLLRQIGTAAAGLAAGIALGLAIYGWNAVTPEPAPVTPVEQEISRNVTFLQDSDLVDEMALIQTMDQVTLPPPAAGGA
jgi:anti-sigma factor RsiW